MKKICQESFKEELQSLYALNLLETSATGLNCPSGLERHSVYKRLSLLSSQVLAVSP